MNKKRQRQAQKAMNRLIAAQALPAEILMLVLEFDRPIDGKCFAKQFGTKPKVMFRAALLHKDPHCKYCNKKLDFNNSTFDHIKPLCKGGDNHRDNLALACSNCNSQKGDKWPWPIPSTQP